jgi:hypothetical protein
MIPIYLKTIACTLQKRRNKHWLKKNAIWTFHWRKYWETVLEGTVNI